MNYTEEDIYNLPIRKVITKEQVLLLLINNTTNYLEELGNWTVVNVNSLIEFQRQDKVVVNILFNRTHNSFQRSQSVDQWVLASVYYDEQPVMIIRNIVWREDGCPLKFITDIDKYKLMIKYLFSFIRKEGTGIDTPRDGIDADIVEGLYKFAGAGVLEWIQEIDRPNYSPEQFSKAMKRVLDINKVWGM
ncbi:hypothetical protein H6G33_10015 [Calothrix sp. FACHB-1219]|uniref:hypothetical protein n=1 Tax=unclassified Calothrix TaxID=2619626 RepID=UPI0016899BE2|nr:MULTISPECIES: hypothetical protein [unclassified Calothrix]MBD2201682.1 hypothetical protein [Calothrix sp. FACHB-168]MBD2217368.1 hypothetical protein [Calothrix sp. FACHB-1219]